MRIFLNRITVGCICLTSALTTPAIGADSPPLLKVYTLELEIESSTIPLRSMDLSGEIEITVSQDPRRRDSIRSTTWNELNITLQKTAEQQVLIEWINQVISGQNPFKNFSIIALNAEGAEILRWTFTQGWIAQTHTLINTDPEFETSEQISILYQTIIWEE